MSNSNRISVVVQNGIWNASVTLVVAKARRRLLHTRLRCLKGRQRAPKEQWKALYRELNFSSTLKFEI
jgi:hypothetical protein